MKLKQPTPDDLVASILDFIARKFYGAGHTVSFQKDRPRLLKWVVLWPAAWLNARAVTLPPERYREIMLRILQDTLEHQRATKVTYLPAYLRQVVQSHWQHHGEDYYAEAKSIRSVVEHTLLIAGRSVAQDRDPVRDLANAARLINTRRRAPSRTSLATRQLDLLSL